MQDQEKNTVDIDTSGPGAEVLIEEIKETTNEVEVADETINEDSNKSSDTVEKSSEQLDVRVEENNKESENTDQGSKEKKKKELEDYSDGVKRRIAKLTKKMREAERREEAAIEYAKKVTSEQEQLKTRYSKLDTGYVSEMENRIKSSLESAGSKLAKAREEGDLKAEISAQTEISKLGYEEAKLSEIKSRHVEKTDREQQGRELNSNGSRPINQTQTQEQAINPDPKAQKWANENSWFGNNEAMTYTAFSLHKKLVEEEGFDPQTEEYYSEINKRIRLEFPQKFDSVDEQTTLRPTQVVASANRTSKPGRKIVRLTPSQVAIAKRLGVPLEEYAKQLKKITKEVV